MNTFLRTLGANFVASCSGRNLIFHGTAIALTAVLVLSGFDWWYFTELQIPGVRAVLFPALVIGMLFPIILPIIMYLMGKIGRETGIVHAAFALAQAAILGFLISSIYKAFTGRIQPDLANMNTDISHDFQFGFLRHGIFWGWPSSHTTVAFSMAFALIYFYRGNKGILLSALLYAFYIGIGVSTSIHWFSDFAAGALLGTAIGTTVGKSYHDRSEWAAKIED